MNQSVEEDRKTLQQEVEAHVEALDGEVVGLREKFNNSLQRSIQGELRVRD